MSLFTFYMIFITSSGSMLSGGAGPARENSLRDTPDNGSQAAFHGQGKTELGPEKTKKNR